MTIAAQLAEFVQSVQLSKVDIAVREAARSHLLDTLGCIAFTTELEYSAGVIDAVASDAGVFGIPGVAPRLTLGDAALLAGTFAAGFELDDVGVFVHPGACIVPVAFLAAEQHSRLTGRAVTGTELLMAIIVGYEVTVRVSEWVGFGPEDEVGWHTPAFHGAIGAAATAARIWGLSVDKTTHAIANATDLAGGGLMQARFGSDVKRIHTGRAAQTGILAARLAVGNVRGRADVFEDPRWGYFRTIRYRGGQESNEALRGGPVLDGLGSDFRSFEKIALKYYPCTAGAQGIIDNVVAVCGDHDVAAEDIERIRIEVSTWFWDQPETLRPAKGIDDANFSYAYAAALAAVARPRRLTEEGGDVRLFVNGLTDSRVMRMQERIEFAPSAVLDAENRYSMDTIAHVELRDGRSVVRRTGYGKKAESDSDGRISFASVDSAGVARKFRTLTERVLPTSTADAVISEIDALETVDDVLPLWRSLHTKETKV